MNEKLEACPYCGEFVWDSIIDSNGARNFECVKCQSTSPKSTFEEDGENDAKQLLNTRPIEDALRAEIARLQAENEGMKSQLDAWAPIMYAHGFINGKPA